MMPRMSAWTNAAVRGIAVMTTAHEAEAHARVVTHDPFGSLPRLRFEFVTRILSAKLGRLRTRQPR